MSDKKYCREDCLKLLTEKQKELQEQGITRYPKRSDLTPDEVVAIKAFLGPWPRALEAAGIKPPRNGDRILKNREKRIRAKRARIAALKKSKANIGDHIMTEQDIIQKANEFGFSKAAIVNTEEIVFDPSFRPYCEEDLCGQYNANYSCPPICGTPEEMKQRVLAHKKALVLQSECIVPDLSYNEEFKKAKGIHNSSMIKLIKELRAGGRDGFMIGASGCSLCVPCKMSKGEECSFPQLRYSCMAAYCIYAKRLAESCEMNYDYRDGILPFFGVYIFD